MTSAISKRQQARHEKTLQDLIHNVPGNDRCADCSSKNPGWASWNLGIFLCMRCAALHRKLGTHISKVKSLSMDTWGSEQVDSMKNTGNVVSNQLYNPKNVKAEIPIDVDEVDGVLERYIRQKYELRTFSGGNARSSSRAPAAVQYTGSTTGSLGDDPPPLPPKPGKKFGFSLRSASSSFAGRRKQDVFTPPLSPTYNAHERAGEPPNLQSSKPSQIFGMRITSVNNNFDQKLNTLRDMGFTDTRRNSEVLKSTNGVLDKAVDILAQMAEEGMIQSSAETSLGRALTPVSMSSSAFNGISVEKRRQPEKKSSDPWEALDELPQRSATVPLPQTEFPPRSASAALPTGNWNPFLAQAPVQPVQQPLEQSFQNLQVSQQPAAQQQYTQPQTQFQNNPWQQPSNPWGGQQMAQQPPVDSIYGQQFPQQQQQQQQQQQILSPQQTGNPFLRTARSQVFTPSNPWAQPIAPQSQSPPVQKASNPFGMAWPQQQQAPPQPSFLQQQPVVQSPPAIYGQQDDFFSPAQQAPAQQQPQNYMPQSSVSQQQSMQPPAPSATQNPFWQTQMAPQQTGMPTQQMQQPQQQQQMIPQQTGMPQQQFQQQGQYAPQQQQQQQQYQPNPPRSDKSSILALYNYPQLAPQRPLQSLPEDSVANNVQPNLQQPQIQQAPQRSVTMPVSGNMNPFQTQNAPPVAMNNATRHVSHESRDFQGFAGSGRHSPDAFAGLSARYVR